MNLKKGKYYLITCVEGLDDYPQIEYLTKYKGCHYRGGDDFTPILHLQHYGTKEINYYHIDDIVDIKEIEEEKTKGIQMFYDFTKNRFYEY